MIRFWWDVKPEHKKMCWVAWDKLTLPKSVGGLGFREIQQFNDALLAKVAWRIIKEPSSLLSRTLLHKYCKNSEFLQCEAPSNCSHGWREILAGRGVLKLDLDTVVGNGRTTKIWSDKWLSTSTPTGPIGPPTEDSVEATVDSLISPSTLDWDIAAIRNILPHYETQIRKFALSTFNMADNLCGFLRRMASSLLDRGML